jgi:hypothetical protein
VRPPWLIPLVCALALLVVGSGSFTALRLLTPDRQASPAGTPMASAVPAANLSANQLYQYVIRQTPSLVDPLDGSRQFALWDMGPGCQFRQQALYLSASPAVPVVICFLRNVFVRDFALQVQVILGPISTLGEQQGCALLFRTHLVQQEGFAFNLNAYSRIDPLTGSAVILQNASLDVLAPGRQAELRSWNPGLPGHLDTPHTLTVIARGSQLTLYIDAQPQLTISDRTFQAGQIGLLSNSTFASAQGTFAVAFRTMRLWMF